MRPTLALCLATLTVIAPLLCAQDKNKQIPDIDAEIQKATEAIKADAAKSVSSPDPKTQDDKDAADDASDAKQEAQQKAAAQAAAQAAINSPGPATLPPWTPAVPQFTTSAPATRKLVDGAPFIILAGTSPLTPSALADAWDAFKKPSFSHERTGSEINGSVDLIVSYRNGDDGTEVRMEAERKPGAKVTQVTLSSPIPLPSE